jgi:hypothetical protein
VHSQGYDQRGQLSQHLVRQEARDEDGYWMGLVEAQHVPISWSQSSTSSIPLRHITLPVTFGDKENFRTEYIEFEVTDFKTVYHAIFGRLGVAWFIAIPNYTYLLLEMPGPKGVISLPGDIHLSYMCNKENCEQAESLVLAAELQEIHSAAAQLNGEGTPPSKKKWEDRIGPSKVPTKVIPLDESDPSKVAYIGTQLESK